MKAPDISIQYPTAEQAPMIRIVQIDVLRGFALLGIYLVNIVIFGMSAGSYSIPNLIGHMPGLNIVFWTFSELYVEGTMRGLFSILFGGSALIFLDETKMINRGLEIVDRYYRRTSLLILFGMIHAFVFLWPYDVLYAYGLIGMFLFPLRKLPVKYLLIAGTTLLLLGELNIQNTITQMNFDSSYKSSPNKHQSVTKPINALNLTPEQRINFQDRLREDTDLHMSGYLNIFTENFTTVIREESIDMYTEHIFDIGGMMLLGMALLKLGILSGKRSRKFYLLLMLTGYIIGLTYRGYFVWNEIKIGFNPDILATEHEINYSFGRLPITLGHIGMIGLLCKIPFANKITASLALVGRMALTNYIMQTVLSIFIFYGFGLGLYGEFEHYQLGIIAVLMWIFQISFNQLWFYYFKLGPLEWAWRSLIYGKRQPIRNTF